jgi:hypothetical protein
MTTDDDSGDDDDADNKDNSSHSNAYSHFRLYPLLKFLTVVGYLLKGTRFDFQRGKQIICLPKSMQTGSRTRKLSYISGTRDFPWG